jgi:hypothetical protein
MFDKKARIIAIHVQERDVQAIGTTLERVFSSVVPPQDMELLKKSMASYSNERSTEVVVRHGKVEVWFVMAHLADGQVTASWSATGLPQ